MDNIVFYLSTVITLIFWGYIGFLSFKRYVSVTTNNISSRIWFKVSLLMMFKTLAQLVEETSIIQFYDVDDFIVLARVMAFLLIIRIFVMRINLPRVKELVFMAIFMLLTLITNCAYEPISIACFLIIDLLLIWAILEADLVHKGTILIAGLLMLISHGTIFISTSVSMAFGSICAIVAYIVFVKAAKENHL